jgi:hypothetical protein
MEERLRTTSGQLIPESKDEAAAIFSGQPSIIGTPRYRIFFGEVIGSYLSF